MEQLFSPIELVGVVTGALGIWLTVKKTVWCWPIILVSIICYMYIFYTAQLYANTGLQFFFFALSIYGWIEWKKTATEDNHIEAESPSKVLLLLSVVSIVPLTGGIYWLLTSYTDATMPFWDALITGLSVVAQLLLAKKYRENWLLWILTDCIAIVVYAIAGLYLTSVLYGVYGVMASIGFWQWRKNSSKL